MLGFYFHELLLMTTHCWQWKKVRFSCSKWSVLLQQHLVDMRGTDFTHWASELTVSGGYLRLTEGKTRRGCVSTWIESWSDWEWLLGNYIIFYELIIYWSFVYSCHVSVEAEVQYFPLKCQMYSEIELKYNAWVNSLSYFPTLGLSRFVEWTCILFCL